MSGMLWGLLGSLGYLGVGLALAWLVARRPGFNLTDEDLGWIVPLWLFYLCYALYFAAADAALLAVKTLGRALRGRKK